MISINIRLFQVHHKKHETLIDNQFVKKIDRSKLFIRLLSFYQHKV